MNETIVTNVIRPSQSWRLATQKMAGHDTHVVQETVIKTSVIGDQENKEQAVAIVEVTTKDEINAKESSDKESSNEESGREGLQVVAPKDVPVEPTLEERIKAIQAKKAKNQ